MLRYLGQCLLGALAVFVLLFLLEAKRNAAVIASLGASAFIAFTVPHQRRSRPRYLLGGYLVGIGTGAACHALSQLACWKAVPFLFAESSVVFAALAVGVSMLVMVVLNFEHPPAAGVALGLVLNNCEPRTVIVVTVGIVSLVVIQQVLKPIMVDLL